jgi:DnaJ-domain-containing protein 1
MNSEPRIDPRRLIVRLAVAVLAADGRITSTELAALEALDRLGLGRISDFAESEIRRAVEAPIDVAATCDALPALSPEGATLLVAVLAEIAGSDGVVSRGEEATLREVAECFGLPPEALAEILAKTRDGFASSKGSGGSPVPKPEPMRPGRALGQEPVRPGPPEPPHEPGVDDTPPAADARLAHAFAVLGLQPGVDRAELDAAYRAIVERYDPARVLDLGTEFAALAVHKLVRATAAFEAILAALRPMS